MVFVPNKQKTQGFLSSALSVFNVRKKCVVGPNGFRPSSNSETMIFQIMRESVIQLYNYYSIADFDSQF